MEKIPLPSQADVLAYCAKFKEMPPFYLNRTTTEFPLIPILSRSDLEKMDPVELEKLLKK